MELRVRGSLSCLCASPTENLVLCLVISPRAESHRQMPGKDGNTQALMATDTDMGLKRETDC